MKHIAILIVALLGLSTFATENAPLNRVSVSGSIWPAFNMAVLGHGGLTYDRIISNYFALSAGGNFEFMGHMHGYLMGGGVDVGAKIMAYSHGDNAFEKGIVAGISSGINLGQSHATGGDPRDARQRRFFEVWFPVSLQLDYIYTWTNNLFMGAGVKSQLFYVNYTKDKQTVSVRSTPYPRLEIVVGMAF